MTTIERPSTTIFIIPSTTIATYLDGAEVLSNRKTAVLTELLLEHITSAGAVTLGETHLS